MVYGNGAFGVTEANYSVVLLHLFTWAIRPQSWLIRPFASLVALPSVAAVLPRPVAALLAALQVRDEREAWAVSHEQWHAQCCAHPLHACAARLAAGVVGNATHSCLPALLITTAHLVRSCCRN